MHNIPEIGYLRLHQILGNSKSKPPIPGLIPICKSSWWKGVKSGRFPQPVKLAERTTAWRVEEIRTLIKEWPEKQVEPGHCSNKKRKR